MEELTMRMGEPLDFEGLASFYDKVVAANSGTRFDVYWDRNVHPSDSEIRAALNAGEVYLGVLGGEIVASAIVNDDFPDGYECAAWVFEAEPGRVLCMHLVATDPERQGAGLGRRFLNAVIDDVRSRGFGLLRLDAFKHNDPACALYEKLGFVCRGVADITYDEDFPPELDIVIYEKQL